MIGWVCYVNYSWVKSIILEWFNWIIHKRNELYLSKVYSSPFQLSFGGGILVLFSGHIPLLWRLENSRNELTTKRVVTFVGPLHASIFKEKSLFVKNCLEKFLIKPNNLKIIHFVPSIRIVVINCKTRRFIESTHSDISVLLPSDVLLSSDFKNSIISLYLFGDVINGMLIFICHPEIAFEINVPIIAPEKHRWLILVVCGCVVPIFHPCSVVIRDWVEPVCRCS